MAETLGEVILEIDAKDIVKSVEQLEKGLGKTVADLKETVRTLGPAAQRTKSGFMDYSRFTGTKKEREAMFPQSGASGGRQTGIALSKALMGNKGFKGIGDGMKNLAANNIPMGKAFAAGGAAGAAMAAIGGILGIVKQALGQSSIFNTVAKNFWTIMGTMADVILMPMLPYMFKFLQWMMTSVMPWVLQVSQALGQLLNGNGGPIMRLWWNLLWDIGSGLIVQGIPMLLKAIITGLTAIPMGLLGFHQGGLVPGSGKIMKFHDGGKVPGGPENEQLALLQGGEFVIPRMDTVRDSVQNWFTGTKDQIADTSNKLKRWTTEDLRQEGGTSGFWNSWYMDMVGRSVLPETKEGTQGWLTDMKDQATGLKDSIIGWITDNPVTNFFKSAKDKIIQAFKDLWGGRAEVGSAGHSGKSTKTEYKGIYGFILKLKDGIPTWGEIGEMLAGVGGGLSDFGKWVWGKMVAIWGEWKLEGGGIRGWIYDNIWSKIPSWASITTAFGSIVDSLANLGKDIWKRVSGIWGEWKAEGGGIRGWIYDNIWSHIPKWNGTILDSMGTLGTLMSNLGTLIWDRVRGIWGEWKSPDGGGIRGWIHEHIWSKIPTWGGIEKGFSTLGTLMSDLGSDIWGAITGLWGDWDKNEVGFRGWVHKNIWQKVPTWEGIKGSFFSLVDTFKDFGKDIYGAFLGIWGNAPSAATSFGGEHTEAVAGKGILGWVHKNIISKIPSWTSIKDKFKAFVAGMIDIGGSIKTWLGNIWGDWRTGGGGVRGWIYDNTVGKLPTMDEITNAFALGMLDLGLGDAPYDMDLTGDKSFYDLSQFSMKGFGDIFGSLVSALGGAIQDIAGKLWDMVPGSATVSGWASGLKDIDFMEIATSIANGARKLVATVLDKTFVDNVAGLIGKILSIGGNVDWFGSSGFTGLKNWVGKYKSGGQAYYGPATGTYAGFYKDNKAQYWQPNKWYGATGSAGSLLPGFQKGGIVPGPLGQGMVALVHGGETITPYGQTNNNNQKTFNIQVNSTMSAADIVNDLGAINSLNNTAYLNVLG